MLDNTLTCANITPYIIKKRKAFMERKSLATFPCEIAIRLCQDRAKEKLTNSFVPNKSQFYRLQTMLVRAPNNIILPFPGTDFW